MFCKAAGQGVEQVFESDADACCCGDGFETGQAFFVYGGGVEGLERFRFAAEGLVETEEQLWAEAAAEGGAGEVGEMADGSEPELLEFVEGGGFEA